MHNIESFTTMVMCQKPDCWAFCTFTEEMKLDVLTGTVMNEAAIHPECCYLLAARFLANEICTVQICSQIWFQMKG